MPLVYQHNINPTTKLGVWHIREDEDFFLSRVPLGRNITHWHKRLQHLAGRYLLPELFPEFPNDLIEIADTRRPFLPNEEFHFSISHCGDFAAAIVSSTTRVGIDIELPTNRVFKIKPKFLHDTELLFAKEDLVYLTLLWSVKEAMFKWYASAGVDFKEDLRIYDFEFPHDKMISTEILNNDGEKLLCEYRIMPEFVLAWVA